MSVIWRNVLYDEVVIDKIERQISSDQYFSLNVKVHGSFYIFGDTGSVR